MNLYERWLALPGSASSRYAEWLHTHDTCPDCCPGREDLRSRKPGCERCGGTGVIEIAAAPIPEERLVRTEDTIAKRKRAAAAVVPPGVAKEGE